MRVRNSKARIGLILGTLVMAIFLIFTALSRFPQIGKKMEVMKNSLKYKFIWNSIPPSHDCPYELSRLGKIGDGGKWVCGIAEIQKQGKSCIVYSFGVGTDLSFENDILTQTNCTVHIYDHTKNPGKFHWLIMKFRGRVTISKIGIGKKNSGKKGTLKKLMDVRGDHFLEILKLDIEGSEFEVLEQIISESSYRLPFRQLLVEIHLRRLPSYGHGRGILKTFKAWWKNLEGAGLRAFHAEPNYEHDSLGCSEYSFLNVRA